MSPNQLWLHLLSSYLPAVGEFSDSLSATFSEAPSESIISDIHKYAHFAKTSPWIGEGGEVLK